MKTIKILLTLLLSVAVIAAGRGSFLGWGISGGVRFVSGGADGLYSATGVRKGGQIWMWASGEQGQYTFSVWCKGAGVFVLQQGAQSFTQVCSSPTWTQLTFPQIEKTDMELFRVSAELKAGDYADMFCLYPSDFGSCGYYNHITNPSFEQ